MADKKKNNVASSNDMRNVICGNLNFAASEAYKLLRTNLLFSLGESETCKIIGVTSSERGEGKSTTSINLAYTLAQTGKKTVLIDADMRLPSISKKMSIRQTPGLSNKLAGLVKVNEIIMRSGDVSDFYLIPAGDIPPNPSELLASESMNKLLEGLSTQFDYVVIDLPPINIVSDALAVSPWINGLVVVVRENKTTRASLNYCMNQLKVIGSKVLGFVMTDVEVSGSKYGKYGKYGKYSKYGK